jgi:hypothetical protein
VREFEPDGFHSPLLVRPSLLSSCAARNRTEQINVLGLLLIRWASTVFKSLKGAKKNSRLNKTSLRSSSVLRAEN